MSLITAVEYDECRSWIKKKRNRGMSWDALLLAGKGSEVELGEFLANKIDEDDWPISVNVDFWKQLVHAMEESERKKIQLQNANRMAELRDGVQENNRVVVPEDERSSWQLYKKHLKPKSHEMVTIN